MSQFKFTAAQVRDAAFKSTPSPVSKWAGRVWARSTDPVRFIGPDAYVLFLLIVAEAIDGVPQRVAGAEQQSNGSES